MKALIALFFLCASLAAAPRTNPGNSHAFFQCELINVSAQEADKSRLILLLGLPVDALSFVKSGDTYEARFGVSIAIIDRDGFGVAEREIQKQLHANDYGETNSRQRLYFDAFEFDLSPGKYTATVTVTDAASGRQESFSGEKVLQDFSAQDPTLALSDIIITNQIETDSTGKPVIAPAFFQNAAAPGQDLYFYLEIDAPANGTPLQVRQIIRNRQNKVMVDQQRPWPRQTPLERVVLPIWTDHLAYGAYELELQVQHGKTKKAAKQKFHVTWDGVPETGMHVQQALAQACLIAKAAERKAIEKLVADSSLVAQRAALITFWNKRDDSPETSKNEAMAAFYQRVEYANEKFGGSREGWKTDPGKIFIQLGMPDAIEVDSDLPRLQRRQLWRYHKLHRQFLFVDPLGFGDFVLTQEQAR